LTLLVDLTVPGKPVPARREVRGRRGGHGKLVWSDAFEAWLERAVPVVERHVWGAPRGTYPLEPAALHLEVESVFARPKKGVPRYTIDGVNVRYPGDWRDGRNYHLGTTDNDNLLKGPGDALVRGGLLQDDRWIVTTHGGKWYAAPDERAHVRIRLWAHPSHTQEALPWHE
jgi:Holliday junction resolvase RusA-like endonuclease